MHLGQPGIHALRFVGWWAGGRVFSGGMVYCWECESVRTIFV